MVGAFFAMSSFKSNMGLYFAAVLYGVGNGFIYPILNVLAVAPSPSHRRGKATSTYFAASDIGSGLGAMCWGVVANFTGYRSVFFFAAFVAVLCMPIVFGFFRPSKVRRDAAKKRMLEAEQNEEKQ